MEKATDMTELKYGKLRCGKLLNYKAFRFKITIIPPGNCRKLQHTIIRIRHTFRIIHGIAFLPYHLLTGGVRQHFHCAAQHHSPEESRITKVNTCTVIFPVLCNTHRRSVRGQIDNFYPLPFLRLQHSFIFGKPSASTEPMKAVFNLSIIPQNGVFACILNENGDKIECKFGVLTPMILKT